MTHIPAPNYTQIPNVIFDHWMHELSHMEFKILMLICRKTFGWHKSEDFISKNQMIKATKGSKRGIDKVIKRLEAANLIEVIQSKTVYGDSDANKYKIRVFENISGNALITPPNVIKKNYGDALDAGGGSALSAPTKERPNTKEKEKEYIEKVPFIFEEKFEGKVHLTQTQYDSLVSEFYQEIVDKKLEDFYTYSFENEKKFKEYKNHFLTLKKWIKNDLDKMNPKDLPRFKQNKEYATEAYATVRSQMPWGCTVDFQENWVEIKISSLNLTERVFYKDAQLIFKKQFDRLMHKIGEVARNCVNKI